MIFADAIMRDRTIGLPPEGHPHPQLGGTRTKNKSQKIDFLYKRPQSNLMVFLCSWGGPSEYIFFYTAGRFAPGRTNVKKTSFWQ